MHKEDWSRLQNAFQAICQRESMRTECVALVLDCLSLRVALQRNLCASSKTCAAVLRDWARAQLSPLALREHLHCLPERSVETSYPDAMLSACVRALSSLPASICTARLPGDAYPLLRETPLAGNGIDSRLRGKRRQSGSFYTPEALVQQICALGCDALAEHATVCDPSMGTGHFLLGVLQYLFPTRRHSAEARAFASTHLYGVDKDPIAVTLARRALWLELSTPETVFVPPEAHFVCGDSLLGSTWEGDTAFSWMHAFPKVATRGGFDAIVGNPPYDVLTNFSRHPAAKAYAAALRDTTNYPLSLCGQLNLYRCFIERALQLLRPGGRLSFVVPAGLWADKVAAPLRGALLLQHATDAIFVYEESTRAFHGVTQAVTVFRAQKEAGEAAAISYHGTHKATLTTAQLALTGPGMPIPDASPEAWELLGFLQKHAPRAFCEIADGRVGEVDQTIYRAHMKDSPTGTLLVRGNHVVPFAVDLDETASRERFLDRDGFLAQKGKAAATCLARVEQPRVIQLGIRNRESRPRLVAAVLAGGVYCGNSVNIWTPKGGVSHLFLAGLLNSALYDWRFRLTSGNNNINIHEINTLPLPKELPAKAVREVEDAARACDAAATDAPLAPTLRKQLDEAVFALFSLPEQFCKMLLEE